MCAPAQTDAEHEKGKFSFAPEPAEITAFWLDDMQVKACYAYRVHSDTRMVFHARRSAQYQALCVH